MASIGISDVETASVNSEKTRTKKCTMIMIIIIIIIMNKSQETTIFGGRQRLPLWNWSQKKWSLIPIDAILPICV